MNNKEYISQMAAKLNLSNKEIQDLTNIFVSELADKMDDGSVLSVQGFGNFEVKKNLERIVVNPTSKQRMLIPPKLALSFKPSQILKEKLK